VLNSFALTGREIRFAVPVAVEDPEVRQVFLRGETDNMFELLLNRLANQLEWFSMAFTHHLADCDVVYQSLHQTYLEIVKILYFRLSFPNVETSEKCFTNIIDLFLQWQKQKDADLENCEKEELKKAEKLRKVEAKNQSKQPRPKPKI